MGQKLMITQKIPERSVALLGCTPASCVGEPQAGAGVLFLGNRHTEEVFCTVYMSPKENEATLSPISSPPMCIQTKWKYTSNKPRKGMKVLAECLVLREN